MEKAYQPQKHEAEIYRLWEESGAFKPSPDPQTEPYCILMPPPNANADLHIGHTLTTTLQDILIRFARMQGKAALFLPGADHAGFETQVVFEQELAKQGKSRFDYSREQLYQLIWEHVQENKGKMEDQQRRIGASCDWSRNTFTLDPHVVERTYQTFKQLYDDGLLYRGPRVVNFCTFHGTSFSDLEVEHRQLKAKLWHLSYQLSDSQGEIVVATTRPETMLGDTAVAVHPDDQRYQHLIGKLVQLPLTDRVIPVVADAAVDQKFGTGAIKVTPAHDQLDFEIGQRHNLPVIQVIGPDGKMTGEAPPAYRKLAVKQARQAVVKDLEKGQFIAKVQDHAHSVGHCYKCGNPIQPLVIDQWLVRMQPLAAKALRALEDNQVEIVPRRMRKVLFQWLENIKDWNISRQIAWGIPIPAYFAADGSVMIDWKSGTRTIKGHRHKVYHQDPDTFDTWFSSGQWPVVTLHYPDHADFKRFYPTAVMETAGEIIFFWVARMIMLGLYLTDEVPFKTVYLHGLVLDEQGKKMSKSRGNVVAPLDLLDKYGADATRLGLIHGRSAALNQGFNEKRVEGYRNFCNKLWNVSRFCLSQAKNYSPAVPRATSAADHWMLSRLSEGVKAITKSLNSYRFSEAAQSAYTLLWDDFADWYIEASKSELNVDLLIHGLETILKLLHPFAPFVTEAIWQQLPWQNGNLITSDWPAPLPGADAQLAEQFEQLKTAVDSIRTTKALLGTNAVLPAYSPTPPADTALLQRLARVELSPKVVEGVPVPDSTFVLAAEAADLQRLVNRLKQQMGEKQQYIERLEQKLANKDFASQAPAAVVTAERQRLETARGEQQQLQSQLNSLKA